MDEAQEVRRQHRGEETRQAFLRAGVELLKEETTVELLSALSSRTLAERALRSTGSFFHHWESADEYLSDLVAYVFSAGLLPENTDEVAAALEALTRDPSDSVNKIRAICLSAFRSTADDTFLPIELLLRSQPEDDVIRAGLRTFYRETDEGGAAAYEALLATWALEPRPPFDYRIMATLFTALLEGLAIRHLVDPESVPPTMYADAVLAMLPSLLRASDDSADLSMLVDDLVSRESPERSPSRQEATRSGQAHHST